MRWVLFYESPELDVDAMTEHFPAHRAMWQEFRDRGVLLLVGPFSDRSGAMSVFTTREAAEEFVSRDPFVLNGVVQRWTIREWMEAIGDPA